MIINFFFFLQFIYRYFSTAQRLVNGFLKSNNYPKTTFIDIDRPSETFSNLIDYTAKRHLQVKVHSMQYIKPAIIYVQDLLKLGKARGLLQQFNATEISDKLTDTLNLEVRITCRFGISSEINKNVFLLR